MLKRWLVATDAFTLADEAAAKAIYDELSPHMGALCEMLSSPEEITVGTVEGGLAGWMEHTRTLQVSFTSGEALAIPAECIRELGRGGEWNIAPKE